ncbi:MAG: PaaI family thioesterase [Promethearchaeota archaeon]
MTDIDEKIKKRSERMINIFNAAAKSSISLENLPAAPAFTRYLNGRIISVKRGEIEIEFKLKPEWANPTGLLHGGMQSAMLDDVIGMTTATLGYAGFLITIDFHVDYLGKVKVGGDSVRVKAKMVREGRNIVHFSARIKDKNGKLIATANSNNLITKYKPDYVKAVETVFKDE